MTLGAQPNICAPRLGGVGFRLEVLLLVTSVVIGISGCGRECNEIVCGRRLLVNVEPPISYADQPIDIELEFGGRSERCQLSTIFASRPCPTAGVSLGTGAPRTLTYIRFEENLDERLVVRIRQEGTPVREKTFKLVFTDEYIDECLTCKRTPDVSL